MEQVHLPKPLSAPNTPREPASCTVPKGVIVNIEKHVEALSTGQVTNAFDSEAARNGFIQKVLTLALLQSVIIEIIILIFNAKPFRLYYAVYTKMPLCLTLTGIPFLLTLGLLIYCNEARKKIVYKYMFIVMLPLTFGSFISVATFKSIFDELCYAWSFLCIALFMLLLQSVFIFQTKFELTVRNCAVVIAGSLFVSFCFATQVIMPHFISACTTFHFTLGVFVLSTYVLCDMLVMTGKHYRFEVTPSDYALCALYLHLDYAYFFKLWLKNKLKPALENYL